jgi:hypothetical protein
MLFNIRAPIKAGGFAANPLTNRRSQVNCIVALGWHLIF